MEHEGNGDPNCNWCARHNTQRICGETGILRDKKTGEEHPD